MADEPDEPLGDLARRIREKRRARASGERNDTDAFGADDTGDDGEHEPATGFDFGSERSDADPGADTDVDDIDIGADVDADVDSDELFEEMDISDIDTDEVWESVLSDEDEDSPLDPSMSNVDADPAQGVESTLGGDHIVPKDDYCESCHFFSAPPTVECSYEGSEIVEIVDSEQFRVRNCPVVAGSVDTYGEVIGRDDG